LKDTIRIIVLEDKKERMIRRAREGIEKALSSMEPPFRYEKDTIKLHGYTRRLNEITLTYLIRRNSKRFAEVQVGTEFPVAASIGQVGGAAM
jgi:hypothetical protein